MLMFGCSVQTLVQCLCMIYKMCHWPQADATKLSDAESQPFLSSWCHNLSSRPPPKAGSGREKSVTVQGFPLQSCTLIHLFQTSRREEAAEGQTSIITKGKNISWMAPGTCSRNMERSDCDLKGKSKRKRRRRCKGKGESSSCDCWTLCGKQMMMLTVICGSIQWAWVFFTPLMKFLHRLCFALPLELLHYITSLTASAFRKRCFTIYHSPPAVFVSSRRAFTGKITLIALVSGFGDDFKCLVFC